MSDLTEFLLARLAEDEAVAQRMIDYRPSGYGLAVPEGDYDPLRVMREVEAKRRIVDQYRSSVVTPGGEAYFEGWSTAMEYAIRTLALVYSDHADYDPSWARLVPTNY